MKRTYTPLLSICLIVGGCSLSDTVTGSSIDYNRALEDVTNNMLVTNLLLARDQAPLHFTDLSQIRGSLQLQNQLQVAAPFGYQYASTSRVRDMVTGTITVATNPTFDVAPLNTKEFTSGITAPIDIRNFWYYLNRGADSQTVVNMLFSKIDVVPDFRNNQIECEYINHPNTTFHPNSPDQDYCYRETRKFLGLDGDAPVTFQDFVPLITNIDYTKKQPTPFGPDINIPSGDLLKGAGSLANAGLSLRKTSSANRFQISKDSKEGVACFEPDGRAQRPWVILHIATLGDPVDRSQNDQDPALACAGYRPSKATPKPTLQLYLYIRSVEAIFQYMGGMLTYKKQYRNIPFYIEPTPPRSTRFSVLYRGSRYYIGEEVRSCHYQDGVDQRGGRLVGFENQNCIDSQENRGDQTLFVLSVLNQLLNLYKKSSDIPTTAAVQAVP